MNNYLKMKLRNHLALDKLSLRSYRMFDLGKKFLRPEILITGGMESSKILNQIPELLFGMLSINSTMNLLKHKEVL